MESFWRDCHEYKNSKYEVYKNKKRFFDKQVGYLRNNAQQIMFGNYKNIQSIKFGQKKPPIKYFINTCKRNHLSIVETDEFNSTKLCYKCNHVMFSYYPENNKSQTDNAGRTQYIKQAERYINAKSARYSKLKYCQKCKHFLDRDFNASINIARIGDHISKHNTRPKCFQR